jgi:hypothetical protein
MKHMKIEKKKEKHSLVNTKPTFFYNPQEIKKVMN